MRLVNDKFAFDGQGWRKGFELFGQLWAAEHTTVSHDGAKYLTRWILYIAGFTLRLHKFWRGDDDRAPHDHPWWFVTFPFTGYWELHGGQTCPVYPWRFHYRPASYRHIVLGTRCDAGVWSLPKPFYTIVVTGRRERSWGFWPTATGFVPWRDWH